MKTFALLNSLKSMLKNNEIILKTLIIPILLIVMSFTHLTEDKTKVQILENGNSYYVGVCGCGWTSNRYDTFFDATQKSYSHKNKDSGCKGSYTVYEYDSKGKKRWVGGCNKCNWESPTTTNSNQASNMRNDHYNYKKHTCSYCIKIRELN
jgi:hypothetical protein